MLSASVDTDELDRFSSRTQNWWDPDGPWRPLHWLTPARVEYVIQSTQRIEKGKIPLSVLDIGCGGGLMCEPLARCGMKVTGLDASVSAIEAAKAHAAEEKLKIAYTQGSVEDFAKSKKKFDVVLALEILEHVADIGSFLKSAAALLKPGGLLIVSTVNRTTKSFLLGIVAAEYILKWVPDGMHDWNRFLRPAELARRLENAGMELVDLTGIAYDPMEGSFSLKKNKVDVNYMATAINQ